MDDISVRQALALPLAILAAMMASAAAIAGYTDVDGWRVFWPYFTGWATAALISVLIWMLVETTHMAIRREDGPIPKLLAGLGRRYQLLIIPGLIFPMFLGAYTWAKASIPFVVGYPWESYWANLDHALLRTDGWRLAHAIMPDYFAYSWTYFYAIIWGFALVFVGALLTVFASRRMVATFYTAMMLSWFIGGFILAYALSTAGPVFAHLVDPSLADRFAPLRAELLAALGPDNIVLKSQHYLAEGIDRRIALKGSGVSAMPSMHIATVTVILLAAWKTRWRSLALLFWGMTFFGSVYLGYHYAVDAPVAAAVAVGCWAMARRILAGTVDVSPVIEAQAQLGEVPIRLG